jgi:predicted enzyme related to lactoylglutathione lyase
VRRQNHFVNCLDKKLSYIFEFATSVKSNNQTSIIIKMKKKILITLTLVTTFALGFAFKSLVTKITGDGPSMRRVTGIGGIFFKCKDPKKMREWYQRHLGLNTNQYGAVFEWRQGADTTKKGFTQWSPFNEKTKYFEPSTKDFLINYRVENLEALVEQFKKDSVTIVDKIETVEYGKFIHIMDIEGNKVELWEPNDIEYEKLGKQLGSKTTK